MRLNQIFKSIVTIAVIMTFSQAAYSKRKPASVSNKKSEHIKSSVNEAIQRSNEEQKKIRVKVSFEADERINSWSERDHGVVEIKHTGATSTEAVDLGDPDFSMEELGEDHSGLNALRSKVKEESTDIDFDKELKDVSSAKN